MLIPQLTAAGLAFAPIFSNRGPIMEALRLTFGMALSELKDPNPTAACVGLAASFLPDPELLRIVEPESAACRGLSSSLLRLRRALCVAGEVLDYRAQYGGPVYCAALVDAHIAECLRAHLEASNWLCAWEIAAAQAAAAAAPEMAEVAA